MEYYGANFHFIFKTNSFIISLIAENNKNTNVQIIVINNN